MIYLPQTSQARDRLVLNYWVPFLSRRVLVQWPEDSSQHEQHEKNLGITHGGFGMRTTSVPIRIFELSLIVIPIPLPIIARSPCVVVSAPKTFAILLASDEIVSHSRQLITPLIGHKSFHAGIVIIFASDVPVASRAATLHLDGDDGQNDGEQQGGEKFWSHLSESDCCRFLLLKKILAKPSEILYQDQVQPLTDQPEETRCQLYMLAGGQWLTPLIVSGSISRVFCCSVFTSIQPPWQVDNESFSPE